MGAARLVPQSQRVGSGGSKCSGSTGVRRFLRITSPSVEAAQMFGQTDCAMAFPVMVM